MGRKLIRSKVLYAFLTLSLLGITLITLALYPFADTVPGLIALNLGVTLLTSGTASIFFEIAARRDVGDDLVERVSRLLTLPSPSLSTGDNRNQLAFQHLIETAGQSLDLMGLTLPDVTEQGLLPVYYKAIQEKGTRVRILLLDPSSEAAKARASYPQYRYAEPMSDVSRSTLLRLFRFANQLKSSGIDQSKFDVRLYSELPLCLTISSHSLLLSVYVVDVIGQHAPYIAFTGDSYDSRFCLLLRQHFDKVWTSGKRVLDMPLNEFDQFLSTLGASNVP